MFLRELRSSFVLHSCELSRNTFKEFIAVFDNLSNIALGLRVGNCESYF